MSFVQQLIMNDGGELRLITAREKDHPCWFLLQINPESYLEYTTKMKSGNLNIRDYGRITQSGWGPPPQPLTEQHQNQK